MGLGVFRLVCARPSPPPLPFQCPAEHTAHRTNNEAAAYLPRATERQLLLRMRRFVVTALQQPGLAAKQLLPTRVAWGQRCSSTDLIWRKGSKSVHALMQRPAGVPRSASSRPNPLFGPLCWT